MSNLIIVIIAMLIGTYYGFTKVLKVTGIIMGAELEKHQDTSGVHQYKIRIVLLGNNNHYELFVLDKPQILVKLISKVLFKHKVKLK